MANLESTLNLMQNLYNIDQPNIQKLLKTVHSDVAVLSNGEIQPGQLALWEERRRLLQT